MRQLGMCIKKWLLILLFVLGGILSIPAQLPSADFEIVESVPLETELDNPDIRNTTTVWLEMLTAAQHSIDIEQFYISNHKNSDLEKVLQVLEARAAEGVPVRIIVEARMAATYPAPLQRLASHANISIREMAAFHTRQGVQHSKFFVVDQERVFIGSQNFDWRALQHIHEIGFSIRQAAFAQVMTEIFNLDWQQAQTGELQDMTATDIPQLYTLASEKQAPIQFFASASPPGNYPDPFIRDEQAILQTISEAEERICIQLLSYSPATSQKEYYAVLDNALRQAALRGVEVQLLLSDWCQKPSEMPYLKSLTVLPNITVKLSTIPQYSGGYIPYARVEHCKYMLVDDQYVWIGTSNWKKNYFYGSRNLGVVVISPAVNRLLRRVFLQSWQGPYSWAVNPQKDYQPKQYGER